LSRPQARRHIHTRAIEVKGYQRDDGLWDIEGSLMDTKTYSFDNVDRGGIAAGEPVHHMLVRLTVDDDLVVRAAEASTEAGPYGICGDVAGVVEGLIGAGIGPGWRKAVFSVMGRTKGCTHITDLIGGPMAVTAFQTVRPARKARERAGAGGRPATLDTCHALASDGPIARRQWPEHYTGKSETER
jgi:hypothetical protein